jgi:hypothetical protein
MKLKKNIATSESGFVFNPSSGDSFSLNIIGAEILLQMKESKSSDEIKKDMNKDNKTITKLQSEIDVLKLKIAVDKDRIGSKIDKKRKLDELK